MLDESQGKLLSVNAPMESFFNSPKNERVFHEHYGTRDAAKRDLFEYIEGFYIAALGIHR